jgi:hypothetical protein
MRRICALAVVVLLVFAGCGVAKPSLGKMREPKSYTFEDVYRWSDGVEVSVTEIQHARMTAEDVEDSDPAGKVGEALVRFSLRIRNGSERTLLSVSGDITVRYGPDGKQAPQRYPANQDVLGIGHIQPGKAKSIAETFAVPSEYQGEVALDFELDSDREPATFSGSVESAR